MGWMPAAAPSPAPAFHVPAASPVRIASPTLVATAPRVGFCSPLRHPPAPAWSRQVLVLEGEDLFDGSAEHPGHLVGEL